MLEGVAQVVKTWGVHYTDVPLRRAVNFFEYRWQIFYRELFQEEVNVR
jgi:hypothetical protein